MVDAVRLTNGEVVRIDDVNDQKARNHLLMELVRLNQDQRRETPERYNTDYFSTGPSGALLANDAAEGLDEGEFLQIEFPFLARTVNIRCSDDNLPLWVAFNSPHQQRGNIIPLRSQDTPFSIGGKPGINADRVWVGPADDSIAGSTTPPELYVTAY